MRGSEREVRLVSRHPASIDGIVSREADALDRDALVAALEGAEVVFNCANAPYHRWTLDLPPLWRGIQSAATAVGARLVLGTNLYALGVSEAPLTNESQFAPCSEKGRVRALLEQELLDADRSGELQVAIVRASDFYGPEVAVSQIGDRFFPPLLRGKPAGVVGRADTPHSYAYLPDVARTMVAVGLNADAFGKTWIAPHAPPVTATELGRVAVSALAGIGIQAPVPTVKPVTRGMIRFAGIFNSAARELIEMFYQFDRPFTVDSADTERELGLEATTLEEGMRATLDWFAAEPSRV